MAVRLASLANPRERQVYRSCVKPRSLVIFVAHRDGVLEFPEKETGMSKYPTILRLLALALACACGPRAEAQSQQEQKAQVLVYRPKCDDVSYSTPTPAELAQCTLEIGKGAGKGWVLTDGNKQLLRRFIDST